MPRNIVSLTSILFKSVWTHGAHFISLKFNVNNDRMYDQKIGDTYYAIIQYQG